jgi:hypothetical protein
MSADLEIELFPALFMKREREKRSSQPGDNIFFLVSDQCGCSLGT